MSLSTHMKTFPLRLRVALVGGPADVRRDFDRRFTDLWTGTACQEGDPKAPLVIQHCENKITNLNEHVQAVLVLTDMVSHGMDAAAKKLADARGLPFVRINRKWAFTRAKLAEAGLCKKALGREHLPSSYEAEAEAVLPPPVPLQPKRKIMTTPQAIHQGHQAPHALPSSLIEAVEMLATEMHTANLRKITIVADATGRLTIDYEVMQIVTGAFTLGGPVPATK